MLPSWAALRKRGGVQKSIGHQVVTGQGYPLEKSDKRATTNAQNGLFSFNSLLFAFHLFEPKQ